MVLMVFYLYGKMIICLSLIINVQKQPLRQTCQIIEVQTSYSFQFLLMG